MTDCSIITHHPDYPMLAKHGVRVYERVYAGRLVSGVDLADLARAMNALGIEPLEDGVTHGPLGPYPWTAESILSKGSR